MTAYRQIIGYLCLTIIVGCSGINVSQDYDPRTDFSGFKTYRWETQNQKKTGNVRLDNPLIDTRIRRAVDRYLAEKGYRKTPEVKPDFYISYQTTIESKIVSDKASVGFGVGTGSRGSRGGVGISSGGGVSQQDEGSLIIDFTDAATGNLIWRGSGSRRVTQHTNPEETTRKTDETVAKILEQFPPSIKQ